MFFYFEISLLLLVATVINGQPNNQLSDNFEQPSINDDFLEQENPMEKVTELTMQQEYYKKEISSCKSELKKKIILLQQIQNCSHQNMNQANSKVKLLDYLSRISDYKTLSGLYVYPNTTDNNSGLETIQRIAGVTPAILSMHMPSSFANETEWGRFISDVIYYWNNGQLVRIEWWDENPLVIMNNFTETYNDTTDERRWEHLIEDGGELNQFWKKHLDIIVPYLKQLEIAGVNPFIDILPITNFKQYIWSGRPGVNGTLKLYQITHDYLTKHNNLNSLIWTWSLHNNYLTQLEHFWPGNDYVDVASVYMWEKEQLPASDYEKLLDVVGDKLLSMEEMKYVPTVELFDAQPRWTWFTLFDSYLNDSSVNDAKRIKSTFNSDFVINKGNIDFFNNKN